METAAAMGIDPSTMVALIDELERTGLAKRRPHPKDRRAREVAIIGAVTGRISTPVSSAPWPRSVCRYCGCRNISPQ